MSDLQFIASQLLGDLEETQVLVKPKPIDTASKPEVEKKPISLSSYLERKKELNSLINAARIPEDADDEESSSSESSDSSDDDNDEVLDAAPVDDGAISDGEIADMRGLMSKNEITELPPVDPPPLDIIPDNYRLIRVGQVSSVVGDLVLVQSDHLYGENQALDVGSLLAFDDRKVLGQVFETLGPVCKPLYSIRFNSAEEIDKQAIVKGRAVFRSELFSQVVLPSMLRAFKGSDASNIHDEEIPESEQEFSDDEQEQQVKRMKKGKPPRPEKRENPPQPERVPPVINRQPPQQRPPMRPQMMHYPPVYPMAPQQQHMYATPQVYNMPYGYGYPPQAYYPHPPMPQQMMTQPQQMDPNELARQQMEHLHRMLQQPNQHLPQ